MGIWNLLSDFYTYFNIEKEDISAMYDYIVVNNGFWLNLANLNFNIMDGVPHPRHLEYCDFFVSFEIRYLLSLDLCEEGAPFTSLRPLCPISCQCIEVPSSECPLACYGLEPEN